MSPSINNGDVDLIKSISYSLAEQNIKIDSLINGFGWVKSAVLRINSSSSNKSIRADIEILKKGVSEIDLSKKRKEIITKDWSPSICILIELESTFGIPHTYSLSLIDGFVDKWIKRGPIETSWDNMFMVHIQYEWWDK